MIRLNINDQFRRKISHEPILKKVLFLPRKKICLHKIFVGNFILSSNSRILGATIKHYGRILNEALLAVRRVFFRVFRYRVTHNQYYSVVI